MVGSGPGEKKVDAQCPLAHITGLMGGKERRVLSASLQVLLDSREEVGKGREKRERPATSEEAEGAGGAGERRGK